MQDLSEIMQVGEIFSRGELHEYFEGISDWVRIDLSPRTWWGGSLKILNEIFSQYEEFCLEKIYIKGPDSDHDCYTRPVYVFRVADTDIRVEIEDTRERKNFFEANS